MHEGATADTVAADTFTSTSAPLTSSTFARSTVLPRKAAPEREARLSRPVAEHPRYEPVRTLGEGGMGEVVLVRDHDIGRDVAVKRLKAGPEAEAAILRFAEEVRTVGHLEHPGIVPIHDVGVDERGQHYLVMKYVEGDTLETIIHELQKGTPKYVERYTHAHRARVFLSMLEALRFAHEKGILHRDLKPANVMVGPYGEVMLMDWGIAKKIERGAKDDVELAKADTADARSPGRLIETAHGALLGTPLYMSPEQALGRTRELDERSDIYSACLLFLELMTLRHPFAGKKTMQELLVAQAKDEIDIETIRPLMSASAMPAEYAWFIARGLAKGPSQRYASIAEMEDLLRDISSGKVRIQCHVTFGKAAGQAYLRWVDRHPGAFTLLFFGSILAMLAGLVLGVIALVR